MAYKDPEDPRARASRRKHYQENKDQYYKRNQEAKQRKSDWLKNVKDVPCEDCGVRYPSYVMDLDHRDPSQKVSNVGRLLGNSWNKLKEEVAKCDIVCSNCHRERTYGNHAPLV